MMILSSFKTNVEVLRVPPTFFPEQFTLENYQTILNDPRLPLLRFYGNSAFVAIFNVTSTVFTSALIGYMFAKYEFRGKRILFGWFLTLMMIPSQITMIPSFLILSKLGLINSLWGLVIFSAVDAFGIFLMRQFCETLPNELLDASRIDGASEWQIFTSDRPAAIEAGACDPRHPELHGKLERLPVANDRPAERSRFAPCPIILTWYNSTHTGQGALVMAATVLIMVPILLVFVNFQRWIVQVSP